MNVKITSKQGYGDRFGVFHERGSVWFDCPAAIAHKVAIHGIGVILGETKPVAPVEIEDISPAVFVADMVEMAADPGEPLPEVAGEVVETVPALEPDFESFRTVPRRGRPSKAR